MFLLQVMKFQISGIVLLINYRRRENIIKIVDLKTYIEEKGVWVSTVAHDMEIGLNRCAETMVFRGDSESIKDWTEVYFESHGYETNEEVLRSLHEEIVRKIKSGEIELIGKRDEI